MANRRHFGNVTTHPPRPGFYVRFNWEGRRIMRYAGPTREIAKQKLSTIHALLSSRLGLDEVFAEVFGDTCGARLTFRDAIKAYMEYAKTRKKASTVATDERHFKVIEKATWAGKFLPQVRPEDIERWVDARLQDGASPATINRQSSLASALFRWAERMSFVETNPFRKVPKLSEKGREKETYLTGEESRALVKATDDRFRPFLVAALSTGMRRGELLTMEWESVDLVRRELLVRPKHEKAGRGRMIPMTEDLFAEMQALRERNKVIPLAGPNLVFRQVNGDPMTEEAAGGGLWRAVRACDAISEDKKPKVTMHTLRHTAASLMVAAGVPLFDVAKILGHSTLAVTMRYAHFAPEAGRSAVAKLGKALGIGSPRSATS